jgi:carbohydrate-selective porin OprB
MAYAHVRHALVITTQPEIAYIMQPETCAHNAAGVRLKNME